MMHYCYNTIFSWGYLLIHHNHIAPVELRVIISPAAAASLIIIISPTILFWRGKGAFV